MVIVGLVEEYVLAIFNLVVDCVLFEDARWTNPMLLAQLLPELATDYGDKLWNYFGCHTDRSVL